MIQQGCCLRKKRRREMGWIEQADTVEEGREENKQEEKGRN